MKDRIQRIISEKEITAWRFADILGVQPSNISHILSGRNKPSYDFIEKILTKFDDISPDWLLLGNGEMFRQQQVEEHITTETDSPTLPDLEFTKQDNLLFTDVNNINNQGVNSDKIDLFTNVKAEIINNNIETLDECSPEIEPKHETIPNLSPNDEVYKIVMFYKSGKCEIFQP